MNRILKHFFLKLILCSDSVRFLLSLSAPGAGPEPSSSAQVNKTTFNISWEPLLREKSYGKVVLYEVKAIFFKKGNLRKRSVIYSPSVNTSETFVVLSDLELCSRYNVSVRAYTAEGPGPYGEPLELETSSEFDEIIMKTILVCDMIGEKNTIKIILFYFMIIDNFKKKHNFHYMIRFFP